LKLVRETDAGVVLSGKVGMHTSPAYAEDVYVGSHSGIDIGAHRASFIVPVGAPGVTVVCRKVSSRHPNAFITPLSSRYDELDGQMWLEDVLIPWERVFLTEPSPEPVAAWLFWHQLYCWLAKAEFTLGLALACTDAMGLTRHHPGLKLRTTNWVEVMAPFLARDFLKEMLHSFDLSISGWGIDIYWGHHLGERWTAGIVDDFLMRHTSPSNHASGAFYTYLKSIGVDPYQEMRNILRIIGTDVYEARPKSFVYHTYLFKA